MLMLVRWVLRRVWCASALALLAGCSSEEPPPKSSGAKQTGVQLKGAAAYIILSGDSAQLSATPAPPTYETNCIICHANAGQGIEHLAPEIRHAPAAYLSWVVRNGRPNTTMLPFDASKVSDADLGALATWLAGLPKPTTGAELYRDFCGNCHGPMGGGGSVPVKVTGFATAALVERVRDGAGLDPSQRGLHMPYTPSSDLSDAELGLIATFLGSK
jgi:mono/diheme cytochrome c family protein